MDDGVPVSRNQAIKEGLARAREKGKRVGRPPSAKEAEIERLLREGWTNERVRIETKSGTEIVRRVKKRIMGRC
jgi:DNA invertase Pin-like site-specific DNA recombinase